MDAYHVSKVMGYVVWHSWLDMWGLAPAPTKPKKDEDELSYAPAVKAKVGIY